MPRRDTAATLLMLGAMMLKKTRVGEGEGRHHFPTNENATGQVEEAHVRIKNSLVSNRDGRYTSRILQRVQAGGDESRERG